MDLSGISVLVINPNTTTAMTDALRPVVEQALNASGNNGTKCDFFTAPVSTTDDPGAIASINSPEESKLSAPYCLSTIPEEYLDKYDCFLVACYSEHPLVGLLTEEIQRRSRNRQRKQHVLGIFEASVITSLGILSRSPPNQLDPGRFGIVTTGHIWEEALSDAVYRFLPTVQATPDIFVGVSTTGLNATELHDLPETEVKAKMSQAAANLMSKGNVKAICLGCAGMVGLENAVREGVIGVLGEDQGSKVKIVDGVASGVKWLVGTATLEGDPKIY